jgi:hypothetical protein
MNGGCDAGQGASNRFLWERSCPRWAVSECAITRVDSMEVTSGMGVPTCGSSLFAFEIDWTNLWQLIIGVVVLAALAAIGAYAIGKVRKEAVQKEPPASELLTKFREMHSRGVLSDEEFRTIKTTLTERLQSELKDRDDTGD